MSNLNSILLASDGSEHALRAASYAGDLARALQAKIEIVTVHSNEILNIQLLGTGAWPGGVPGNPIAVDEVKSNVEAGAIKDIFEPTISAIGELASPPEPHQFWGHPGEVVCEQATAMDCGLIVIGSRGRSTFVKIMLGSVTTQVLHHAKCPVTVVK